MCLLLALKRHDPARRPTMFCRYCIEGAQGREELPGGMCSGQLDSFATTTPVAELTQITRPRMPRHRSTSRSW